MAKVNVRNRNKNKEGLKANWEYRFEAEKINGKRKHISKSGFRTKKEALEEGAKALTEYKHSQNDYSFLSREDENILFEDFANIWLENYVKINLKPLTYKNYRSIVNTTLVPLFDSVKIKDINAFLIQNKYDFMIKNSYAKTIIKNAIIILRTIMQYAIHPYGIINRNPVLDIQIPKAQFDKKISFDNNVLSYSDYKRIIDKYNFGNKYFLSMYLGWNCGLRIGEVTALTWDNIDWSKKTLTIKNQLSLRNGGKNAIWSLDLPKYDSIRTIYLSDEVLNTLKKEHIRQQNNKTKYGKFYKKYILVEGKDLDGINGKIITQNTTNSIDDICFLNVDDDGKLITPRTLSRMVYEIKTKLKIKFHYHMLRHTHATILAENNVQPKAIQQRLGHKTIATTMEIYVQATNNMQKNAAIVFERSQNNGGQMVDKRDDKQIQSYNI